MNIDFLYKRPALEGQELGFEAVYLYTTLVNFYEKTGWEYLENGCELLDGIEQRIYRLTL